MLFSSIWFRTLLFHSKKMGSSPIKSIKRYNKSIYIYIYIEGCLLGGMVDTTDLKFVSVGVSVQVR